MPENRPKAGGRTANRTSFKPGQSGNPGGRPKKDPEITEILAKGGPAAASFMVNLLNDPEAKVGDKQRAAEYILDRLMGKAAQPIQADVFRAAAPLTLDECFAVAEEVLYEARGAGGHTAP